ncbi:cytochrome P450 [Pseudonocardiaceae bacterium YIM PH 21723]|nr:cytochrome P450 [Pseudonocardiaceae bacterium YIM PH 21723]
MTLGDELTQYPFVRECPFRPAPEYARRIREERVGPVTTANGSRVWLIAGYAESRAVLFDPRFSRDAAAKARASVGGTQPEPGSLLSRDGLDHVRLRRAVAPEFTFRRIQQRRPDIERLTEHFLDEMTAKGNSADLIAEFARPLPAAVVCELIGIPIEERSRFELASDIVFGVVRRKPAEVAQARMVLFDFVREIAEEKKARPDQSMFSRLLAKQDVLGQCTEEELVNFGYSLLVMGHQATAQHLAVGALNLLRHPRQLARLRAEPDLMPAAVEELLRHSAHADGALIRVATEDLELGGVQIKEGDLVLPSVVAANRDVTVYADPDELNIERVSPAPHLTMGYGDHLCLGAHLARMEIEVALSRLLERLPGLRLAVPVEELVWWDGWTRSTLRELPITW